MVETETSKLETHVKKCILRDYKVYFVSVEIDMIDTQLCKLTREQV